MKTKRKLKLKKHWEYMLLTIQLMLFICLCSEWDCSFFEFFISRSIILIFLILNQIILCKYTDICDDENLFEGEDLDV